jgi:hypothetical protein
VASVCQTILREVRRCPPDPDARDILTRLLVSILDDIQAMVDIQHVGEEPTADRS